MVGLLDMAGARTDLGILNRFDCKMICTLQTDPRAVDVIANHLFTEKGAYRSPEAHRRPGTSRSVEGNLVDRAGPPPVDTGT